MPVAIDTSVLIAAEKIGGLEPFIAAHDGLFYIPAHVAAEFLVGTHPPVKAHLRERARRPPRQTYQRDCEIHLRKAAAQLAALNAELRRTGKVMGFFDAAIAATVIARQDSLLVVDSDFDRLSDRIELLKP